MESSSAARATSTSLRMIARGVRSPCDASARRRCFSKNASLDPLEHRVEGDRQPARLVVGPRHCDAFVELVYPDLLRVGRYPFDRSEGRVSKPVGRECSESEDGGTGDQQKRHHPPHCVLDRLQTLGQDQDADLAVDTQRGDSDPVVLALVAQGRGEGLRVPDIAAARTSAETMGECASDSPVVHQSMSLLVQELGAGRRRRQDRLGSLPEVAVVVRRVVGLLLGVVASVDNGLGELDRSRAAPPRRSRRADRRAAGARGTR